MGDEGFYDPELHSILDDERVLHVPVCSVGAQKSVWTELLGVGGGDWTSALLKNHVASMMEMELGKERAHRKSFDKQLDLPAWYSDQTMLSAALHSWTRFPDDVELVHRNTQRDRIDRMMWKVPQSRRQLERYVSSCVLPMFRESEVPADSSMHIFHNPASTKTDGAKCCRC